MIRQFLCAAALLAVGMSAASAQDASDQRKVTLVYDHELPNVSGKSIRGVLVEYGPGGSSAAHTHPSSAFIYATVLEGAIRSQVNDGPLTTYHATAPEKFPRRRPPARTLFPDSATPAILPVGR
jgi:quercetin dioxygenase-like cupin family protein